MNRKKINSFIRLNLSYILSLIGIRQFPLSCSPWFVSIELAAFCNLRCPECPTGRRELARKSNDVFDTDLFRSFVDRHRDELLHLILYFQGEPLLNKNLSTLIAYAHRNKIFTSISTNAQLIKQENARALVESGLDKLIISIDGLTQEVYEQYRVGGKLSNVFDAIRHIVYWKNKLNSTFPFVELQMIVFRTNEHQIEAMRLEGKKLGVNRVVFKTAQLYDFENGHPLMPLNGRYSRYKADETGKFRMKNPLPNHCWRLWNGAVVNVHGEVLPCCYDKNSSFTFGNVASSNLEDILHNKKASDFRSSILNNRKQFEMCRNCTGR